MKKVVINYKDLTKKEKVFYWIRKVFMGIVYIVILFALTVASIYSLFYDSDNESSVISASAETYVDSTESYDGTSGVTLSSSDGVYSLSGDSLVGWYWLDDLSYNHISINYECYYESAYGYSELFESYKRYIITYSEYGYFDYICDYSTYSVSRAYTFLFLLNPIFQCTVDDTSCTAYLAVCPYPLSVVNGMGYDSFDEYIEAGEPTIFDYMTVTCTIEEGCTLFNLTVDYPDLSVQYTAGTVTSTYYGSFLTVAYSSACTFNLNSNDTVSNYFDSSLYDFSFTAGVWRSGEFCFYNTVSEDYLAGYDVGYSFGYYDGFSYGYDYGLDIGLDASSENAYNSGYLDGEKYGYDSGYNYGYTEGYSLGQGSSWSDPVITLLGGVANIFNIELFGYFSLGTVVQICLYIFIVMMFIRMFT